MICDYFNRVGLLVGGRGGTGFEVRGKGEVGSRGVIVILNSRVWVIF